MDIAPVSRIHVNQRLDYRKIEIKKIRYALVLSSISSDGSNYGFSQNMRTYVPIAAVTRLL